MPWHSGIPAGIGTGAIVWATIQIARRPESEGKLIVAIAPLYSERNLSSWLFDGISLETDDLSAELVGALN